MLWFYDRGIFTFLLIKAISKGNKCSKIDKNIQNTWCYVYNVSLYTCIWPVANAVEV